jgi:hypothetical protein
VALTSPIGFIVLGVFMVVITFSEMLLGQGRLKAVRLVIVLVLAAGFSAFWYSPKFVFMIIGSSQGQLVKRALTNLLPPSFFFLPLLGVFGFLLFENRPQLQSLFIGFFLTVAFGLFSLGAGLAHPAPSRFLAAFGLSLAFLMGVLIVNLFDFLRLSPRLKKLGKLGTYQPLVSFGLLGILLVVSTALLMSYRYELWQLESTQVLGLASEQKVGLWNIKDQIKPLENFLGYSITGATGLLLALIKLRLGI